MNKRSSIHIIITVLVVLMFIGCQDVFTFSPFEALQRDPASLPDEQKKTYATSVLANGTREEMNEAYTIISDMAEKNKDDGDLQLLAADLAMGSSGMGDIIDSVSTLISSGSTEEVTEDPEGSLESFETMVENLDTEKLTAVSTYIEAAETAGAEVSSSQYVNAGMALAAKEVKEKGVDNIDIENPSEDLQKALDYAEKGGVDLEAIMNGEFEGF